MPMSPLDPIRLALARIGLPSALVAPSPAAAGAPALDWHADPEGYRSNVPSWLRRIRIAALAAVTLWALLSTLTYLSVERATRAVGHDAAPSVVAAEKVRALLADADGELADSLLVADAESGPFMSSLRQDVRDAQAALVDAARNITYGDEEAGPILTVSQTLARWVQMVGEASGTLRAGDRAGAVALARRADTLMHFSILPAATELERVNFDHMSEAYGTHGKEIYGLVALAGLSGVAALAILLAAQRWLFRTSRRILDLPLAGATAVVVLMMIWGLAAVASAEGALKTAKQDAFDSVHALASAQAWSNDANAAESYWLLDGGDAGAQERDEAAFLARSGRLVGEPIEGALADARDGRRIPGLLGDELANVTFPQEREAAQAALAAWRDYVNIDAELRALQRAGRTAEAIALDVGTRQGQSNWAFARFAAALRRVSAINEAEFRDGVAASESAVGPVLEGAQGVAWAIASAAILFGIARRLRAYEFSP